MANTKGGGNIIIGVEKINNNLIPTGMTDKDWNSFDQDDVQEKINEYADPFIEITLYKEVFDSNKFVIIQVMEFSEIPVVCKKNFQNLNKGEIYCRPKRKIESVPIPSQNEIREILDMSFEKRLDKMLKKHEKHIQIEAAISDREQYLKILQKDNDQLNNNIQILLNNGSYWKTTIFPFKFKEIGKINELTNIIEKSQYNFGFDVYPTYSPALNRLIKTGPNWIEFLYNEKNGNFFNGSCFDYWRFYTNGLFVYYSPINFHYLNMDKEKKLYIEWTVWKLTSIFEFVYQLSQIIDLDPKVEIFNSLEGIDGFTLDYRIDRPQRFFMQDSICRESTINLELVISINELRSERAEKVLIQANELFYHFNQYKPEKTILEEIQNRFYEKII